jgi:hypothetical protein
MLSTCLKVSVSLVYPRLLRRLLYVQRGGDIEVFLGSAVDDVRFGGCPICFVP